MNKNINFNLAMLAKEVGEGEMLTTFEHVAVGQEFKVDGAIYTKEPVRYGTVYDKCIHQEVRQVYNSSYLVAGEYKCYKHFVNNDVVITKEA